MDFKGNRYELRLSLLEAFTSYLAFCERCSSPKMLRETLENPNTHSVNAYRLMDGETDDLYYQERNNHDEPAIREYRLARATKAGWLPCFLVADGGWSRQSPQGCPGVKWGYWRVPLACVGLCGNPGVWENEIKHSMPDPHVFMAIEMTKILIAKLNKYRTAAGEGRVPGEYGGEILDFFAVEAHISEPLWDLYREAFGLNMTYPAGFDFPDSGRLSARLCALMDRFHGRKERRIAY